MEVCTSCDGDPPGGLLIATSQSCEHSVVDDRWSASLYMRLEHFPVVPCKYGMARKGDVADPFQPSVQARNTVGGDTIAVTDGLQRDPDRRKTSKRRSTLSSSMARPCSMHSGRTSD